MSGRIERARGFFSQIPASPCPQHPSTRGRQKRMASWARQRQQITEAAAAESPLRWSVALDAPSAEVLQTQAWEGAGEKGQGARGASLRATAGRMELPGPEAVGRLRAASKRKNDDDPVDSRKTPSSRSAWPTVSRRTGALPLLGRRAGPLNWARGACTGPQLAAAAPPRSPASRAGSQQRRAFFWSLNPVALPQSKLGKLQFRAVTPEPLRQL